MTAHPSFDLREQAWIPVRRDGDIVRIGLRELFLRAHVLDDLAVPVPPAASGLWRILYAIAARITGLDSRTPDPGDWAELRKDAFTAGRFDADAVDEYFERWADRFDLFDRERPFGQDARLRDQCPKSAGVNKLVFSRPVGQNQVWFGHFSDLEPVPVPAYEAAWHLIAQLYYGAAGRCGTRTVDKTSVANSNAGPLRGSVSYHPLGRTVFESLLAGLPDPSCSAGEPDWGTDVCLWEHPAPHDPLGAPPRPGWPGGLLTDRNRHAVLLVPSPDGETVVDAYVTWAWQRPAAIIADPYLIRRLSKEGSLYTPGADSARALWRDLDALLLHDRPERRRAPVLNGSNDLPDDIFATLRLRAYGFDQDRQAKDKQWFTATTPPIFAYLEEKEPTAAAAMQAVREAAEEVEGRLRSALRTAWRDVISPDGSGSPGKSPDGPWPARAAAVYWPRAERVFWDRLYNAADHTDRPLQEFVRLAIRVIDEIVEAQERPRVAKAAAHARALVRSVLKKETAAS